MQMQKITPWLWFDGQAEEAARFYTSVFPNSRILEVARVGGDADVPGGGGPVTVVTFELDGLRFAGLNGGPEFTFTEAVSFQVSCDSQDEVDRYWDALLAGGGEESMCGWLRDRFGLSWQIIPTRLMELTGDPDPARAGRAMRAMLGMRKIDVAEIERAAAG